jgi:hypothetical protein
VLSVHGATAARSAEARELSERVQSSQSSGGITFLYTQARTQVAELAKEKEEGRGLREFEILPSVGRNPYRGFGHREVRKGSHSTS